MIIFYFALLIIVGIAAFLGIRNWRIKRTYLRELQGIATRTEPKIIHSMHENDRSVVGRYNHFLAQLEESGNNFRIPVYLCIYRDAEYRFESWNDYLVRLGTLSQEATQSFSIELDDNNRKAFLQYHLNQQF